MSPVERQALRYARAGIPVLPVSGKLPLTKNGLSDATVQDGKLGFWFRNYVDAGVALACGHQLNCGGYLVVFDVDVQHDGDYYLGELERERGELPETWTVRTPSGAGTTTTALPSRPGPALVFGQGWSCAGSAPMSWHLQAPATGWRPAPALPSVPSGYSAPRARVEGIDLRPRWNRAFPRENGTSP